MSFSWLGTLFHGFLHLFDPLKELKHWRIWAELWKLYTKIKAWRDWYKSHIGVYIQREQALRRQLYDQFFQPVLALIDKVRQISQIVGLFNQRLAAKLDAIFFRIEGFILEPLNAVTNRINTFNHMFGGFLTPLGYLDRATLLNSIWRDIGSLKELLRNPLGGSIAAGALPAALTIDDQVSAVQQYSESDSGPIAASVNAAVSYFQTTAAELEA